MAMTRADIPAYFQWRKGRPRWEPGPSLRRRGFKGQDLKDASGRFLTRGAAIDLADTLNAATRDPVASTLPPPAHKRTFSQLVAELKATRKFRLELDADHKGHKRRRLKKRTRDDYLAHLAIIEQWCGDLPVAALKRKAIENWYDAMIEAHGLSRTNAIMRTFRLAMNFGMDVLEWNERNPVCQVEMEEADGRRVIWTPEEIAVFVRFADALNLPEYGDAMVIGALVGLRQGDLLAAPRLNLDGETAIVTAKRGQLARVPMVRHFRDRVLAARARLAAAAPTIVHRNEIVCTRTGRPFTDRTEFRDTFRLIRLYAAGFAHALAAAGIGTWPEHILALEPEPSLLTKQWADLRDTSVTLLLRAGCTDAEIATIQGRSLASVTAVIDKHYFVRDDGFARAGAGKLEAYLDQANLKW